MGLAREALVAYHYGASAEYNSFVIAMRIPQLLLNMFFGGAVVGAFIPAYIQKREHLGEPAAREYARAIVSGVTGVSLLLALGIQVFAEHWVTLLGPGLSSPQKIHAINMTQITGWALPVFTFATLLSAILNAHEQFKEAGSRQLVLNLSMIAAILTLGASFGVEAMVAGFWGGSLLQIAIQWPSAKRVFPESFFGNPFRPDILREFTSTYFPIFATHLMLQSTYLLDARYGSLAGPTGVSSMAYADRFVDISRTIIASSLAVVIFPKMSRMAARQESLMPLIHRALGLITLTVVPIVLALLAFGESFVRLFYERGQFGPDDTATVMAALMGLAPAALFFGILYVLDRVFLAQKRIWTYAALMAAGVVVNLICKEALLATWGLTGVGLGTSVGGATSVCLAFLVLERGEGTRHLLDAFGIATVFAVTFLIVFKMSPHFVMPAFIGGYGGIVYSSFATLLGFALIHIWQPRAWLEILKIIQSGKD